MPVLGYAVVATDYAGWGGDSGKPVVDMQSNALDVIYSVPAARAAVPQIGPKWIAVGSSQGSLAALSVAESQVRDPNLLGSVANSGLADAQPVYQRFAQRSNRMLLVLTSTLRALYPEFQVTDMLKDAALPAYQRVTETCGGEAEPGVYQRNAQTRMGERSVRNRIFQQKYPRSKAGRMYRFS